MSDPKQVIIVRKDLGMRKGKMIAQGAHASMKVVFDRGEIRPGPENGYGEFDPNAADLLVIRLTEAMSEWFLGLFTKVVVGCDSEEELLTLAAKADAAGIPHALVVDSGRTEFHGKPTPTALAIGPDLPEKIDPITGHLKLL